jgi:hypothetical protein
MHNSGGSLLNYAQCTVWAWTSGEVYCPWYSDLQYTMSSPDIYYIRSTVDGELVRWYDSNGNLVTPNEAWVKYKLGSLQAQIINPDEVGVPGTVCISGPSGTSCKATDSGGSARFDDLKPGAYTYKPQDTSYLESTQQTTSVESEKTAEEKALVVEDMENVAGAQKQTETNFAREYYGYLIDFGNILSFNNVPKSLMEGSGLPAGPATRLTGDILGSSAEYLRGKELISGALYGDMIKVARPLAQAGKYGTLVGDVFIGAGIGLGIAGGENPDTIMERTGGFYKFFYDLYGKYLPDQKGWLLQLKDSLDKMVTDTMKEFRMEIAIV